jgi:hypothetical protein
MNHVRLHLVVCRLCVALLGGGCAAHAQGQNATPAVTTVPSPVQTTQELSTERARYRAAWRLKTSTELLAENAEYRVWSEGFAWCTDCAYETIVLWLGVEDRLRKETHRFQLKADLEADPEYSNIRGKIAHDRFALVGDRHGGLQVAAVLQLAPDVKLLNRRDCSKAGISDDGTRVACTSPIPLHLSIPTKVVLNVLDVGAEPLRWVVVYPPENAARQNPDPIIRGSQLQKTSKEIWSDLSWSPDSKEVVFVEASAAGFTVVEVDLRSGLSAPRAHQGRPFDYGTVVGSPGKAIVDGGWFRAIEWLPNHRLKIALPKDFPECAAFSITVPSLDPSAIPQCVVLRPTPTVRGLPTRPVEPNVRPTPASPRRPTK